MQNIHASCFEFKKRGVVLRGDSGSGKSDVLLRAIMGYGAKLISDDRTDVCVKKSTLIASSPKNIAGKIEVRGVGIKTIPYKKNTKVCLVVDLFTDILQQERMPEECFCQIEGVYIKNIKLYSRESSVVDKIISELIY